MCVCVCVCVSVIRHNLPLFRNVKFFVTSVFLTKQLHCWEWKCFFYWGGVMFSAGWVGLCVIAQKTKVYPHLHVVKNPYPQNVS